MIIQVVNFNLEDLSDADYRSACDGLAPELARVPGLISKVWLADEASNTYGGVYTWVDHQAMDAFAGSDFFKAFASNPNNRSYQPRAYANDYSVPEKVYQYTASVQQELPGRMAATAAYVGSQGRNLFLRSVANQITQVVTNPNPANAAIVIRQFSIPVRDAAGNIVGVQNPFAALWRAPVSSTVTQAAPARPARNTSRASPRKRPWRPINSRTTCRLETSMPIASRRATSRGTVTWP